MEAIVGGQKELIRTGVGFFHPASPYSSSVGTEVLTGPRDLAAPRRLVQEAGYRGEPIVQMAVPENPASYPVSEVVRATLTTIGLNVDFQTMDLGTMLARTRSREASAPWHCHCAVWSDLWLTNPCTNLPLYGPTPDARMDALKAEWLRAPDQESWKSVAATMQRHAFDALPFPARPVRPAAGLSEHPDRDREGLDERLLECQEELDAHAMAVNGQHHPPRRSLRNVVYPSLMMRP